MAASTHPFRRNELIATPSRDVLKGRFARLLPVRRRRSRLGCPLKLLRPVVAAVRYANLVQAEVVLARCERDAREPAPGFRPLEGMVFGEPFDRELSLRQDDREGHPDGGTVIVKKARCALAIPSQNLDLAVGHSLLKRPDEDEALDPLPTEQPLGPGQVLDVVLVDWLVALDLAEDDHRPEGVYDGGDAELRSPIRADDLKPGCLGLGVEAALVRDARTEVAASTGNAVCSLLWGTCPATR